MAESHISQLHYSYKADFTIQKEIDNKSISKNRGWEMSEN